LYRWKKLGGGSLRLANRIIKPGQVFLAAKEELPKAFMDTLELLSEADGTSIVEKQEEAPVRRKTNKPTFTYEITPIEDKEGFFNIVRSDGKVMNEGELTEEEANQLLIAIK